MLLHSLWLAQTRVFLSHPICPNSHMPHLFDFFFFLAALGLYYWAWAFSSCGTRASLIAEHGL